MTDPLAVMTLALSDNEYGIDSYNSFLGEVQRRLIEMNLNPPKWPDTMRDLGDLDAALDSCTEWCADRLMEIHIIRGLLVESRKWQALGEFGDPLGPECWTQEYKDYMQRLEAATKE